MENFWKNDRQLAFDLSGRNFFEKFGNFLRKFENNSTWNSKPVEHIFRNASSLQWVYEKQQNTRTS